MTRTIRVFVVLTALATVSARSTGSDPLAATPAPHESSAEATTGITGPVIPKRTLKFEISDEAYPVKPFAADLKLLEQRYVVVFHVPFGDRARTGRSGRPTMGMSPGGQKSVRLVRELNDYLQRKPGEVFESLISDMPENERPSPDMVMRLTKGADVHVKQTLVADEMGHAILFEVFAPTAEDAKETVRALLSLYDDGLSRHLQQEMLDEKLASLAYAKKTQPEVDNARKVAAGCEKRLEELKGYEDITAETLLDFKIRRRTVGIDMAGIETQIKACDENPTVRKLKQAATDSPVINEITVLKIKAEIELAGLATKKAAIDQIIEKGQERLDLTTQLAAARKTVATLESQISKAQRRAAECEQRRKDVEPFSIDEDKVVIHPIKWDTSDDNKWWRR